MEVSPLSINDLMHRTSKRVALARTVERLPRGRAHARVVYRQSVLRRQLWRALNNEIASGVPNLIYERSSLYHGLGARAARRAGVPLILEVNAPLVREAATFRHERLGTLQGRQERAGWRAANRVVAVSSSLASEVRAAGQADVVRVGNAVDHSLFNSKVESDPELRSRIGPRTSVGFSGTLQPWHDLETLVAGVGRANQARPFVLVLIGEGPGTERVGDLARALELDTIMTGAVPHTRVPRLLAAVDMCVSPMSGDPAFQYFSPLKALEYLALGKPTVVAAAGDLQVLAAEGAALAYEPGSAEALALSLMAIEADPALRARLAGRAREVARRSTWVGATGESLRGLVEVPNLARS